MSAGETKPSAVDVAKSNSENIKTSAKGVKDAVKNAAEDVKQSKLDFIHFRSTSAECESSQTLLSKAEQRPSRTDTDFLHITLPMSCLKS